MNKNTAKHSKISIGGIETNIGQWFRREDDNNSNEDLFYIRKSHIISRKDEFIDLSETELEDAKRLSGNVEIPNGKIVRERIRDTKKPLLILYLLDPDESLWKYPMEKGISPFVGYAISFPKSNYNAPVSYAVNEELLDRFDFVEEDFEDYGDDED